MRTYLNQKPSFKRPSYMIGFRILFAVLIALTMTRNAFASDEIESGCEMGCGIKSTYAISAGAMKAEKDAYLNKLHIELSKYLAFDSSESNALFLGYGGGASIKNDDVAIYSLAKISLGGVFVFGIGPKYNFRHAGLKTRFSAGLGFIGVICEKDFEFREKDNVAIGAFLAYTFGAIRSKGP